MLTVDTMQASKWHLYTACVHPLLHALSRIHAECVDTHSLSTHVVCTSALLCMSTCSSRTYPYAEPGAHVQPTALQLMSPHSAGKGSVSGAHEFLEVRRQRLERVEEWRRTNERKRRYGRTADRQEYVSPVLVQQLRDTGVSTADAVAALKYANNDPAAAIAYLTAPEEEQDLGTEESKEQSPNDTSANTTAHTTATTGVAATAGTGIRSSTDASAMDIATDTTTAATTAAATAAAAAAAGADTAGSSGASGTDNDTSSGSNDSGNESSDELYGVNSRDADLFRELTAGTAGNGDDEEHLDLTLRMNKTEERSVAHTHHNMNMTVPCSVSLYSVA
eukprot:7226-Heterococcus_DN1.PRE.2